MGHVAGMQNKKPVHVVAGLLGVGKTTAILHWLQNRNSQERVAVLVNDFGANGLDGDILGEGVPALKITPITGGCVCCTSAAFFAEHLGQLAADPSVDRIVIEPSGMVKLDQMLGQLRGLMKQIPLQLQPVVVLINAARFNPEHFIQIPLFESLADNAEILVANRADLADGDRLDAFRAWAGERSGHVREVHVTEHGVLPEELFTSRDASSAGEPGFVRDGHEHCACSDGMTWPRGASFDLEALRQDLAAVAVDPQVLRVKAMMGAGDTWRLMEVAQGRYEERGLRGGVEAKAEWIAETPGKSETLRRMFEHRLVR